MVTIIKTIAMQVELTLTSAVVEGVDSDLKCIIGDSGNDWKTEQCNDPESKYYTFCDENNIVHSNYTLDPATIVEGPWADVEPDEDVRKMKKKIKLKD